MNIRSSTERNNLIKPMTAQKEVEEMAEGNEDAKSNEDAAGNEDAGGGNDEETDGSADI